MADPKIVYLTAGAGGMFCGSCMHDNALAKALTAEGLDVQLVPTYTPIRTDEANVSVDQVFFGGINVYLQQKLPPLRWVPQFLDRFLDSPSLIRRVTSNSIDMSSDELGKLAVSMLKGIGGNQRKEVGRLCHWLNDVAQPEAIVFSNILIGGCIPEIKRTRNVPVIVTLQGDDVFLDSLSARFRGECLQIVGSLVPYVDMFVVHTEFYKDYMSEYFNIPRERIRVTPLGIDVDEFAARPDSVDERPATLGYLARLAPEKGLHQLVSAFIKLKQKKSVPNLQLRIAGWLGKQNEAYAEDQFNRIREAGYADDFQYLGALERQQKLNFLTSIDVFSVPTDFLEPKGLYVLEALSAGLPVVQPAHGSFPELIEQSGGGLLFEPGNENDYCEKLVTLLLNSELRAELSERGRKYVLEFRAAENMGRSTANLIRRVLAS